MRSTPDTLTYAAFGGAVVIGGANFIAVSISNVELPPVFGAALRFSLAAVLFALLLALRRLPLARGRDAMGAALYGLLGIGTAYAMLYYSLVGLPAGTVAVIVATVPLFTLAIAVLSGQERLSARGVVGGALAIAGIAILSLGTIGGDIGASYLVAAVAGAIAIAGSSVVARSFRHVHPLNMNTIGTAAGTVLLVATSLALGEAWAVPRATATLAAVAWLVVLGSVGLFQLFLFVIGRWTASATSYAIAAMPVVAAILGVVILDQPITAEVLAGGGLVIAAVYIGALSRGGRVADAVGVDAG